LVAKLKGSPEFARVLRRTQTDVERKLWGQLRGRSLAGTKFRRQVPIGRYVADFCSIGDKLIIELDGSQHADSTRDEERTAYLEAMGFRVLRFWNHQVNEDMGAVLDTILAALGKPH
jgi:very-short-patch-repair endonuclease